MGYIEHQQNRIRARQAVHSAGQHVHSDAFIVGIRRQAVHAGQIDDSDLVSAASQHTHALLNRHARVIADLLTKAGQTIEERRLPGIGWADQGHRSDFTARVLRDFPNGGDTGGSLQNDVHGKSPRAIAILAERRCGSLSLPATQSRFRLPNRRSGRPRARGGKPDLRARNKTDAHQELLVARRQRDMVDSACLAHFKIGERETSLGHFWSHALLVSIRTRVIGTASTDSRGLLRQIFR